MSNDQAASARFRADVIAGLDQRPRSIPSKYLYDARGSMLFAELHKVPEYYVTRADLALHERHLPEIAERIGPDAHIIEFGSGAGIKTRKLLAALTRPRAYTPIEISASALSDSARTLENSFPELEIRPIQADYTRSIDAAALTLDPPAQRRIVYFPGSTIGNFLRAEAIAFLARMRRMAGPNGAILIGVDLLKPVERLLAAYDDAQGVTAEFNLNLLNRLQTELSAQVDQNAFAHEARFNARENRIEMHLVARQPTTIILGDRHFNFAAGESIHTENSHKYSPESFAELAELAGLRSERLWFDPDKQFSMHWLKAG